MVELAVEIEVRVDVVVEPNVLDDLLDLQRHGRNKTGAAMTVRNVEADSKHRRRGWCRATREEAPAQRRTAVQHDPGAQELGLRTLRSLAFPCCMCAARWLETKQSDFFAHPARDTFSCTATPPLLGPVDHRIEWAK